MVLLHYYTYGKPKTELELQKKSLTVIVDRTCGRMENPLNVLVRAIPDDEAPP